MYEGPASEAEVDEGSNAGRAESINEHETGRDARRLPGERQALEAAQNRAVHIWADVLRADTGEDREEHGGRNERRRLPPGGEEPFDHLCCTREGVGAEEDPREADDVERHQPSYPPGGGSVPAHAARGAPPVVDESLAGEPSAVDPAPRDERPGGAMPEAPQQHRHHQVPIREEPPAAIAAERDVEVVPKPARERHVPATPEVLKRDGGVGRIEVLREVESEQQGD